MGLLSYNTTSRAVGAFQNLNLWELSFNFPKLQIPDNVRFRCVSAELPDQEEEHLEATINRFKITQPSHISRNGTLTFTFTESESAETRVLQDAISKLKFAMDDKDATGTSEGWLNIKGTIIAYLLSSAGKKTQGYKLRDCDLRPKFGGSLGSDAEILQPQIEVMHNWWDFLSV